jgi:hypothetical protein
MICVLKHHICSKYWEVWRFKTSGMLRRVETSVILYQSARCDITEHLSLQQLRCDTVSHLTLRKLSRTTNATTTNKQRVCRVVTIFMPNILNYDFLLVKLMLHFHLSGSTPKPLQPFRQKVYSSLPLSCYPALLSECLYLSLAVQQHSRNGSAMVRDFSFSLGFGDRPSRLTGIVYTTYINWK